jgi:hypothetical protein
MAGRIRRSVTPREAMRRWQAGFEGMDRPIAPMMVLPAGRAARGLDVLP